MARKIKPVPRFSTEAEERAYWETHNSADHLDWSKAKKVRLPNLKENDRYRSLKALDMLSRIGLVK